METGPIPPQYFFEPQSLRGDPAPGGEAEENVAATLTGSLGGVSGKDDIAGRVVAGTLTGGARGSGGYSHDDIPLTVGTVDSAGDRGGTLQDAVSGRLIAFGGNRQTGTRDLATALNAHGGPHGRLGFETETFVVTPFDTTQITSAANRSNPKPGAPCHPLSATAHPPAIAFDCKAGGDTSFSIGALPGALRGEGHGGGHAAIAQVSGVRRLMPVECERLQGVPDHFTRIPWRGRPAEECPDGPRYRALGNAYPRPVLAWIGQRINTALAADHARWPGREKAA